MMGIERTRALRLAGAAGIFALGLTTLFLPEILEELVFYPAVEGAAENGVDRSLQRNAVTFLSLSGLKSVMASIEGSAIGVGFHLEVGDLIQPAYDYVDFVWRIFLYALTILGFYKLVIETEILRLGFALVGVGLMLWSSAALELRWSVGARRWGRRCVALGAVVAYVLPLSLLLTQLLSAQYLEPLEQASAQRIEEARAPLREAAKSLALLREELSIFEPGKSIEILREETGAIANQATEAIWDRLQAFLVHVVILIVELLVLPFLSAYLMYKVLALALRGLEGNSAGAPLSAPAPGSAPQGRVDGADQTL